MTPKPAPEIEDDIDPILESARNPRPHPEDHPLIEDASDLHTLWCLAQSGDNLTEARELRDEVDRRLNDLERRHG